MRKQFIETSLGLKCLTSNAGFLDFSPNTTLGGGFCSKLHCPESSDVSGCLMLLTYYSPNFPYYFQLACNICSPAKLLNKKEAAEH